MLVFAPVREVDGKYGKRYLMVQYGLPFRWLTDGKGY